MRNLSGKTIKNVRNILLILISLSFFYCTNKVAVEQENDVVIENAEMRLILGSEGTAKSLIHKATGEECLIQGKQIPAFSIVQYRPYDNEVQLTYVSRPTTFSANSINIKGDTLFVGFENNDYIAVVSLDMKDDYIGFTPEYFIQTEKKMGVVAESRVDEIVFLQLPIKNRTTYGEWLNVMWDDEVAVGILATDVYTRVDDIPYDDKYHLMRAAGIKNIKLTKSGAALIVSSKDDFLDCVESVECDYNLPKGVKAREDENIQLSYYECRNLTPANVDKQIEYALQGGFRMMVIYYTDFASSMGHFTWREEYPKELEDLKQIVEKIKKAGLIPGFHIHYNKAQINDPYVTPVPDSRLNIRKQFTLSSSLSKIDTIISVEENPDGITLHEGRRLLKNGDEIIEYTGIKTDYPFQFTGCKRGTLNTVAYGAKKGMGLGLFDVDNWPIFIRFNQKTSIQDEVADRIAEIVKACEFKFIYFDGAEDVNRPYWYNISLSQKRVYDKLNPKPMFSEGASKTQFNWHIQSRGNAFDHFKPEHIKEAVDNICIPAAQYNAASFTGVDFGWIAYTLPSNNSIGIQPDMIEYILSHSIGCNSVLSLVGIPDNLEKHPRTNDNLKAFKTWEDAKVSGFFTTKQKEELKKPGKEFTLLINERGDYELLSCEQIIMPKQSNKVRAFIFNRKGKVWVSYWHTSGEGSLELLISHNKMKLFEELGNKIELSGNNNNKIKIPIGKRRYAQFDLPKEHVVSLFVKSTLINHK